MANENEDQTQADNVIVNDEVSNIADLDVVDPLAPEQQVLTDEQKSDLNVTDETVDSEVYLDDDTDIDKNSGNMTEFQLRKAFKEERDKRKAKAVRERELVTENEQLKDRLNKVESSVDNILKVNRPDPYDYSSTEDFYQALDDWNSKQLGNKPVSPQQREEQQTIPSVLMNDSQEFHLYQSEEQLKTKLPDYEQSKLQVEDNLKHLLGTNQDVISALAISAHTFGLDPAKIIYALDKIQGAPQQLAAVISDPAMTRMKLAELEGKVKFRPKQKVNVKPEQDLNQSGQFNSDKQAYNLAFKKWQDNPTLENHKKAVEIKKRLKVKGT